MHSKKLKSDDDSASVQVGDKGPADLLCEPLINLAGVQTTYVVSLEHGGVEKHDRFMGFLVFGSGYANLRWTDSQEQFRGESQRGPQLCSLHR